MTEKARRPKSREELCRDAIDELDALRDTVIRRYCGRGESGNETLDRRNLDDLVAAIRALRTGPGL